VSWEVKKLGDLLKIQNGYAFDSKLFSSDGEMPLIRIRDIKKGVDTDTRYTGEYDLKYVVKKGDLLIGMDGEFGCYEWQGNDALLNQRVCRLQSFENQLYPRFLLYGINSYLKAIEDVTGYTTVKHISSKQIANIEFPIPPLATQKKIVAKLDAIFAEIDKATAAAENNAKNANLLVRATITRLIKKFSEDCFVKFGDICGFVRGPFGGSLKKSIFVEKGYAVYEQQHPINNQFDSFRYFITDEKFNEMKRFEVFAHDLLMSCSGVTLGKIAIVPKDAPKGIINQALLKITPKDTLRKDYLKMVMESDYFQSTLWDVSGGAAQPNVPSVKVIKDFLIPLPTIKEQDDFIDIVSSLLSYDFRSVYKEKKKSLTSLKQAILKQAFSGELVKD
jgi:type I restriction enzyme S subunit